MNPERWAQIEAAFNEAVELSEAERSAFLERIGREDPALRREIERLIAKSNGDVETLRGLVTKQMSLSGQSLGHYAIAELIGAGGMGEVYRARDTKLKRDVAIKSLPPEFLHDSDRIARFEREARVLALLNHPNIAAVHGMESSGRQSFLVMELVEGETLYQRIARGPIPIPEALAIAKQIAEAMEAAHEKGIVHRDLKPANVKITPAGKVKVLDFGLAKLSGAEVDDPAVSGVFTLVGEPTKSGQILGTAAYMAPEQARGKKVDKRADIWAWGCVLYEMLTGVRAFDGETTTDVIAKIIAEEPDWTRLPTGTTPSIRTLVRRTLEKDASRRLHDIADVRIEIDDAVSVRAPAAIRSRQASDRYLRHALRISAVAILAIILTYAVWRLRPAPAVSFSPANSTFTQITHEAGDEFFPTLSPDGEWVAYVSRASGKLDIYLQSVTGKNAINLTKDFVANNSQPAFSPDGQLIAFRSERDGGGVFVMGRTGEKVQRISDFGYSPAWSPDGKSIAVCTSGSVSAGISAGRSDTVSELWILSVDGKDRRLLYKVDAVQPSWSPHDQRIAFWSIRGEGHPDGQRDIWTIPAAGGPALAVTSDAATDWDPVWSPDGRYLYYSSNRAGSSSIWRIRIDEQSGRTLGAPEAVTQGTASVQSAISISRDGKRIAYADHLASQNLRSLKLDPARETIESEPINLTSGSGSESAWWSDPSPDGRFLAVNFGGLGTGMYVTDLNLGHRQVLLEDGFNNWSPVWSPDGKRLAFFSNRSGSYDIWLTNPSGQSLEQLTSGSQTPESLVWSPDNSHLVFLRKSSPQALLMIDARKQWKEQTPEVLLDSARFSPSSWSRDGKRILGYGFENGGILLYNVGTRTVETLRETGRSPHWLRDEKRILFTDEGNTKLYIMDSRSHRAKLIFTAATDAYRLHLSPDDRTIYYTFHNSETDIWLMTMH